MNQAHRSSFFLLTRWSDVPPAEPLTARDLNRDVPVKTSLLRRVLNGVQHYRRRRVTVLQLSRMSDQQLADIGIDRAQVRDIADGMATLNEVAEQRELGIRQRFVKRIGGR